MISSINFRRLLTILLAIYFLFFIDYFPISTNFWSVNNMFNLLYKYFRI